MTVQEYLDQFGSDERAEYARVKNIVTDIIPEVEETIAYGIPTFKYKGKNVIHFGAFKDHMSLFPGGIAEQLSHKLEGYKISKGTVQYTKDKQLPEEIIREFITLRLEGITR